MSAAMDVKRFLAVERDLDRSSRDHRKFGHADLVGKWIALAAEAAAYRSGDDADAAGGKSQNFGQRAMDDSAASGSMTKR